MGTDSGIGEQYDRVSRLKWGEGGGNEQETDVQS